MSHSTMEWPAETDSTVQPASRSKQVAARDVKKSRKTTITRTHVNFALDCLLLLVFVGLLWVAVVVQMVFGEFVGADRGLGYLINLSKGLFNTPLMFAALIALAGISLVLYLIVTGLEYWLLAWRR